MFEKHSLFSLTNRMTKIADHVWQAGKGYLTMGSESLSQKALNINPIHQTDTHQGEPLPSLLSMLQNGVSWCYHHPKKIMMLTGLALAYSVSQKDQRDHERLSSPLSMNFQADVFAHQVWDDFIPSSTHMLSQMAVIFSVGGLLNHPDRYPQVVSFLTPLNLMTLSSVLPMINAQITQTQFLKTFGGNLTDVGRALTTTPTGEIVMVGETTSFGAGLEDVLVAKFFTNGSLAWVRILGGSGNDFGNAITTTPTGDIVLVGYTWSFGAGNADVFVAKLFGNGSLVWARTLGGSNTDVGNALTTTVTDEIVVVGYTWNFGAGSRDVLVTKLFANGTLAWARTLGGNTSDIAIALTTPTTGEIVVTGYAASFGAGSRDVLVTKLFANGTLAWARTLGGSNTDVGWALTTTPTAEIVVAGYTDSFGAGSNNVLVAKLLTNGTLAWARTLGGSGNDRGYALTTMPTGEIVVAGDTDSFGAGDRDVLVAKFLANGTLAWARTLGGSSDDRGYALRTTSSGEIVVAGQTGSFGLEDVLLAKLDANGMVPGCSNISAILPTLLNWTSINNSVIAPTFTSLNTTEISIQDWTNISTQFITLQELLQCSAGNLSMNTLNNPSGTSQTTANLLITFSPSPSSRASAPLSLVSSTSLMGTDVSSRPVATTNNPSNTFTSRAITQSRGPIIFSVSVSPTPIVIEPGISTILTTNYLSLTGNANPSEVVYTVQGNNPDVVFTVNGIEATLFTHADVVGQFVEFTLQGSGCQDYFNTVELQASSAGSSSTVDFNLIFEATTPSCNAATRLTDTAILNTALLLTASGLGFWVKGQDKKQNEQATQANPSPPVGWISTFGA